MAAAEVQLSLSQSDRSALDSVLKPHLRLEPLQPEEGGEVETSPERSIDLRLSQSLNLQHSFTASHQHQQQRKGPPQRSVSLTSTTGTKKVSRPSVLQSTIETDNKRRPAVLRRISSKYDPPSPEPPDPNSEAKSVTIRRMQGNLEEWDKQLLKISEKKAKNDSIHHSELEKREADIADITDKYTAEHQLRTKIQHERNQQQERMRATEIQLSDHRQQARELQGNLAQYETAYQQLEARRNEQEQEILALTEQLEQSEGMRRRLNDQVTELQGQLAIEEQRSRFCAIL